MSNKTHDSDVTFIKALAELLNENDLTELQVKREYGDHDALSVRVSRKQEVINHVTAPAPGPTAAASLVHQAGAGVPRDSDPETQTGGAGSRSGAGGRCAASERCAPSPATGSEAA